MERADRSALAENTRTEHTEVSALHLHRFFQLPQRAGNFAVCGHHATGWDAGGFTPGPDASRLAYKMKSFLVLVTFRSVFDGERENRGSGE
jgi:hypothetical protein